GFFLIGAGEHAHLLFAAELAQEGDAGGGAVGGAEAVGQDYRGVAGEVGDGELGAAAGRGDDHVVVVEHGLHLLHKLEAEAVGVEVVHRRVEVGDAEGVGPGGGVGDGGLHQLVASAAGERVERRRAFAVHRRAVAGKGGHGGQRHRRELDAEAAQHVEHGVVVLGLFGAGLGPRGALFRGHAAAAAAATASGTAAPSRRVGIKLLVEGLFDVANAQAAERHERIPTQRDI